ncbi:MAG: YetF domain-containing protein [Sporolactobacillus sp.]
MGTSMIRMLCLALLMFMGFRKSLNEKVSDQSGFEIALVFSAVELIVAAVIMPEKPLLPLLMPFLILILIYRSRFWLYRFAAKWSIHEHLIQYLKAADFRLPKKKPDHSLQSDHEHPRPGLSLIENGKVRSDNLEQIGKTQLWLRQELRKFGYRNIRQVNYLRMDPLGNFYMDLNKYMRND